MTQIESWLDRFLGRHPADAVFTDNALWRDYLAFGWDLVTHEGASALSQSSHKAQCRLMTGPAQHSNTEFVFEFEGPNGRSKGLVELANGKASRLFTSLEETADWNPDFDHNATPPQVAIIGAGQGGLALGARLQALGVSYVIIEQNDRVGDNWRGRYDSLVLHDPTWVNHLPFKPFPADWPPYTPKDMMGDWLESYASDLALNVWTGAALTSARFEKASESWALKIKRHGKLIDLNVHDLVFAVGTSGFAHTPSFPGMEVFEGRQMHSSAYRSGHEFKGQQVAIVGATNSAHDIAVDLVKNGAMPTMIQRSSTHVVPHQVYVDDILKPVWGEQLERPLEHSDFLSLSMPMRRIEQRGIGIFNKIKQDWAGFYASLEAAGMALDFAEDGAGILGKYRRTASGYYIDVGGSQRVMDGEIALRSGVGVSSLLGDKLVLSDDSSLAADAVIYATGFGSMEQWVVKLVDQDTAEKIGPCWGYGSGVSGDPGPWVGELRNMWKPTAQRGLWFMGGNLAQARVMSRYLALQLNENNAAE